MSEIIEQKTHSDFTKWKITSREWPVFLALSMYHKDPPQSQISITRKVRTGISFCCCLSVLVHNSGSCTIHFKWKSMR